MSTVARDAAKYSEAAHALRKLVTSPPPGARGRELFGDIYTKMSWRNTFMRRLEVKGLVVAMEAPVGGAFGRRPKIYQTTPELTALVEAENIDALLWGGRDPVHYEIDPAETESDAPVSEPPPAAGSETDAVQSFLAGEHTKGETLEAILKLTVVVLENVVVIRQAQDKLAHELSEIRKAWE